MDFHLMDIPSVGDFYFNSMPLIPCLENSIPKLSSTSSSVTPYVETPTTLNPGIGDFYFSSLPLQHDSINENVKVLDPFSYEAFQSKGDLEQKRKQATKKRKVDYENDVFTGILQNLDKNIMIYTGCLESNEILDTSKAHLKRGPKYMSKEERELSKTKYLNLYQNIWRLLFRKNSTVTLSSLGSQCCSFYAHGVLDKCPSGKSDVFDFFRTAEHLWSVIELSSALQEQGYALTHFFFMKLLLPWKLQPRFTPCPSRPDVEPLENDRIYQKGKIRGQEFQKQARDMKSKVEIRDVENLKQKLWNDLQNLQKVRGCETMDFSVIDILSIPKMEFVFEMLNKSIHGLDFTKMALLWPHDPSQILSSLMEDAVVNDETFGLYMDTFKDVEETLVKRTLLQCAKVLSSYGSLIRKCSKFNVDRGPLIKNPPIHVENI